MSHWTVSASFAAKALRLSMILLAFALTACGPSQVQVEGEFPAPLMEPLPLKLGLWYADEFRNHEFSDEAKAPGDSDWVVSTGKAQVAMWDTLLQGMFVQIVHLEAEPGEPAANTESLSMEGDEAAAVATNVATHIAKTTATLMSKHALDGILIPSVDELQYAIPTHTNIKVYEIWMRYRFKLVTPAGEPIAEWTMSSYGKTPTAFLQSDEAAVNLAAVMALRDAGANFAVNFTRVPVLQPWLQSLNVIESP